jgi:hypothetical protein
VGAGGRLAEVLGQQGCPPVAEQVAGEEGLDGGCSTSSRTETELG